MTLFELCRTCAPSCMLQVEQSKYKSLASLVFCLALQSILGLKDLVFLNDPLFPLKTSLEHLI